MGRGGGGRGGRVGVEWRGFLEWPLRVHSYMDEIMLYITYHTEMQAAGTSIPSRVNENGLWESLGQQQWSWPLHATIRTISFICMTVQRERQKSPKGLLTN